MSDEERCHCGRPLHYTDAGVRTMMEQFIADLGPLITVRVGERRWRVPRHYIALHGLKAEDLPTLGFEEEP